MSHLLRVEAYADGAVSKNGQPGWMGFAAVGLHRGQTKEKADRAYSERATNNRAELYAIKLALELIRDEFRRGVHLLVFSDSEWSVRVINGVYRTSAHSDLIQPIRRLILQYGRVEIQWIRGHAGHQYNERANDLAQEASRK